MRGGLLSDHVATVRRYLERLGSGATGAALAEFFTGDARQIELPNKLNPRGGESDLPTLLARSVQGKQLLARQSYDVISAVAEGDRVAVEARWEAELAVSLGTLAAGASMKAHFAMFFEFRGDRIAVQRNYDCFEPW
jgi:ketosteroid isomerase-like protein